MRTKNGGCHVLRQMMTRPEAVKCKRKEKEGRRIDLLKGKEQLKLELSKLSMSTSVDTRVSIINEVAPTMVTGTGVHDQSSTNNTLLEILRDLTDNKIRQDLRSQVFTPAALAKDGIKNFQNKRDPKIFNPNNVDSFLTALEIEFRTNYVPEDE